MSGHGVHQPSSDGLRARFQPLLLTGAAIVVLPLIVSIDPPVALVGVLVGALGLGAVVAGLDARGHVPRAAQERWAGVFVVTAVAIYLWLLVATAGVQPPQRLLTLAAALLCALVAAPARWLRWVLSAGVLAGTSIALVVAGLAADEVVLALALLAATTALAWTVSAELRAARHRAWAQRDAIARRSEMLQAVRSLPQDDAAEAAQACCEALARFGADAAAVSRLVGDELRPIHLVGIDPLAAELRADGGVSVRALRQRRTVTTEDGAADGAGVSLGAGFRGAVAVPLVAHGTVVGTCFAAWRRSPAPTAADIELVEVLTTHLGAITAADELLGRQRDVLDRLGTLDRMRRDLLGAMSTELRDPLTVLRATVQILDVHDHRITPDQRQAFLTRLEQQTGQLRRLVDGVLDFARSPEAIEPDVDDHPLVDVLAAIGLPVRHGSATQTDLGGIVVRADIELVASALELLRDADPDRDRAHATVSLDVASGGVDLVVAGLVPPLQLLRSLAVQMLTTAGATVRAGDDLVIELSRVDAAAGSSTQARRLVDDRRTR